MEVQSCYDYNSSTQFIKSKIAPETRGYCFISTSLKDLSPKNRTDLKKGTKNLKQIRRGC